MITSYWQERLANREASGLSIDEFCADEDISRSTFYRWAQRLRDGIPDEVKEEGASATLADIPEPKFLPVSVTASPVEIELPYGGLVRLPVGVATFGNTRASPSRIARGYRLGALCVGMECDMHFRLRSLFILILFAALGSLLLRHILKPRLVVGEVTASSHHLRLIEVSIGANDGAAVGQSVVVTYNGGSADTARIIRVSEDHALAKNSNWDKWTLRYIRKGDRVLLLPPEAVR